MSADIVDLAEARAERTPHLSGSAACLGCGHQWTAVAPLGTYELQCPNCTGYKGIFRNPVNYDGEHWQCGCGCDIFSYHCQIGMYCHSCGALQDPT